MAGDCCHRFNGVRYKNIVKGIFKDRPNRFIANVEINNELNTVHVKNTGRCRELLVAGAEVILEGPQNPDRKTKYDLIAVYSQNAGLVNIDSQAPNKAAGEWLIKKGMENIKPEFTYGSSRLDFYFENAGVPSLMEVKGVTLIRGETAYFPDAPTERGIKHLNELIRAAEDGYEAYIAFVIQAEGVNKVAPNMETHPEFGQALKNAMDSGVKALALGCAVKEAELYIDREFTIERLEEENV